MENKFKKWTWNIANEGIPQVMFDEHNEAVKKIDDLITIINNARVFICEAIDATSLGMAFAGSKTDRLNQAQMKLEIALDYIDERNNELLPPSVHVGKTRTPLQTIKVHDDPLIGIVTNAQELLKPRKSTQVIDGVVHPSKMLSSPKRFNIDKDFTSNSVADGGIDGVRQIYTEDEWTTKHEQVEQAFTNMPTPKKSDNEPKVVIDLGDGERVTVSMDVILSSLTNEQRQIFMDKIHEQSRDESNSD